MNFTKKTDSPGLFNNIPYLKFGKTPFFMALMLLSIFSACQKDDFEGEVVGVCPVVVSTDPMDGAVDVPLNKLISATFNTSMEPSTINNTSFSIYQGTTKIAGTVAPTADGAVFTFQPATPLLPFTTYRGVITTAATDTMRTAMVEDYEWTFTTIPMLTVSADPAASGTASGGGAFAQSSVVTVNAVPNTGFVFLNWTETDNGPIISNSASYQFTMNGNRTLIANFAPVPVGNFAVNLSSSPIAGGTTTGAGSFASGSSVVVTASPNAGFTFVDWTENGTRVSTSSNIQFTLNTNRTFVANFRAIPASQFAVVLTSSPAAGGTTDGEGAYASGASVTVSAVANTGYSFTNWTNLATGAVLSTSANYTFPITANRSMVANFALNTYTLNVNATNGTVAKNPDLPRYNHGSNVILTATPAPGYVFSSWTGDASGSANPLTVNMNANKNITANFTLIPANTFTLVVNAVNGSVQKTPDQPTYNSGTNVVLTATPANGYVFSSWTGDATGSVNPLTVNMNANKNITANFTLQPGVGPAAINLRSAADFAILSKAGISTTGVSSITGDIGVSPIAATAMTGFSLVMHSSGEYSTTPIVTGRAYASDYAAPTPSKMTTAISDMETAWTTGYGLTTPAPIVDLYAGDLSGRVIPPGLYKYNTGVLITNAGVTLTGGPNDVWVFQIAQGLTINNNAIITLLGGAQAKNVFWVVSTQANIGSNARVSGNILTKTLISMNTGATVNGRLLSQTAVTLNASTVVKPN